MIEYEVSPHEGVGPVKLGMSRTKSRTARRMDPEVFDKGGWSLPCGDRLYPNTITTPTVDTSPP